MDAQRDTTNFELTDEEPDILADWMELPLVPLPSSFTRGQYERLMANLFGKPVSLRAWLAARPRSRAEILEVFAVAGRKLAADHVRGRARGFNLDVVRVLPDGEVRLELDGLGPSSPRDDQLWFCAALWEALYGQRPVPGEPRPPKGRWIPSWIHQALARGLCRDPGQRFDSMAALLTALAGQSS